MRSLSVLLILALAACGNVRPSAPEVIKVEGPTKFVPIDPKLTFHPPLPGLISATPLQCPAIAEERRGLLEDAYRQLDSIKAVQGTTEP